MTVDPAVAKTLRPFSTLRARILELVPNLAQMRPGDALVSRPGSPYQDLHFDVLRLRTSEPTKSFPNGIRYAVVSFAHYFKSNGDLVPDPDMEVEVSLDDTWPVAEALTFQNSLTFQRVYEDDPDGKHVMFRPALKKDLNSFLGTWLKNMKDQKHVLAPCEEEATA